MEGREVNNSAEKLTKTLGHDITSTSFKVGHIKTGTGNTPDGPARLRRANLNEAAE